MALLVNDEYVDDAVIRSEAEAISRQVAEENLGEDEVSLQMRTWESAREIVIGRVLLKQAALAATAPVPEDQLKAIVEKARAQSPAESGGVFLGPDEELRNSIETDMRMEQFLAQVTASAPRPKNSEIAGHYRKHRDMFRHPELVRASHIVKNVDEKTDEVAARAGIEEVSRALQQSMPFAEAADRFSDCPGRGGDLGVFARGQMVEEFDAAVFGLRAGEVSGIFRTPFGFHIAKLHEKIAEGIWPLDSVRGEIETAIMNVRTRGIVEQIVGKLLETAKIIRVSKRDEARV
jgi:parvulin-like peptidyl-prolyl isomerase